MTQHAAPVAAPVATPVASSTAGNATATEAEAVAPAVGSVAPSLREQIDDAMAQLLGVSAKFRDLTGQDRTVSTREETIAMMHHYMDRLEMTQQVRKLSVIHVAGTKGKGSTCAMTERILRQAGYKTGLFTSPHLITPCERVRINGKPVAADLFLSRWRSVWKRLEDTSHKSGVYPPMAWFFRFLTLLALDIFVAEQVDVVILEVGIGGRLDATNVVEKPVVCGITTLDLDHTRILGTTLDKIAYAKAGIFKKGVVAFTTPQEPLAMATLLECAKETGNVLLQAPHLDACGPNGSAYVLGMQGEYQRVNAGLSVALATTWLAHTQGQANDNDWTQKPLDEVVRIGLENAFWPARAHSLDDPAHHTTFYIDGAHTIKSLEVCAQWYDQQTATKKSSITTIPASTQSSSITTLPPATKRVLFFTIHYERNVASIIAPLLSLGFDKVYFCATSASRPSIVQMNTFSQALKDAHLDEILAKYSETELKELDVVPEGKLKWQHTLARLWRALATHYDDQQQQQQQPKTMASIHVLPSAADCIQHLRGEIESEQNDHWSVLATGSLYLAGETLEFMQWSE